MQPKIDQNVMNQISKQLEDQLRKKIYDALSQFLDAHDSVEARPAVKIEVPESLKNYGVVGQLFEGIASVIGNAVRFSMQAFHEQKKQLLRQAQEQLGQQLSLEAGGQTVTPHADPEAEPAATSEQNNDTSAPDSESPTSTAAFTIPDVITSTPNLTFTAPDAAGEAKSAPGRRGVKRRVGRKRALRTRRRRSSRM